MTNNNIKYLEYYEQNDSFKKELLDQIGEVEWAGGKFLYNKICKNELNGKVYFIYDEDNKHIIAFASLSEYDEIYDTNLKPWIGCLYVFKPYRGNRYSEKLIKYILNNCKDCDYIYISTTHVGLYEKYGFVFKCIMKNFEGKDTQVFEYKINR